MNESVVCAERSQSAGSSLYELQRCHLAMDECFLLHQEALLVGDLGLAARCLALYRRALRLHIRQEDNHLLPRYAAIEAGFQWPARLYSGEHRKLELHLRRCCREFAALCAAPERRRVLALLERHKSLKHLAEHHHQREEESLFPALDAALPAAERAALVRRLQGEWERLLLYRPRLLARLRRRLGPAGRWGARPEPRA